MTVLTYVSQAEMKRRTGFGKALGYSFPQKDEILVRKGMSKDVKAKVLAHEEEHIINDEEGPFLKKLLNFIPVVGPILGTAASLIGGKKSSGSQTNAAATAAAGSERELQFHRESRDLARADQAPYREAGTTALAALMSMTGLGGGGKAAPAAPQGNFHRLDQFLARREIEATGGGRRSSYGDPRPQLRYAGGPIDDNTMYNINEMGPENVYSRGAMTRNPNPMTIGGQTGYVQPNIQGRYAGGVMGEEFVGGAYMPPQVGYSPPQVSQGGVPASGGAVNPGIAAGGVMENPGGVEGGYNFMTDPGYNFRMDEGVRAMDRSAAARGGLLSGGYGRKLTRYAQDYASGEYNNVYNRISNIAGLGQVSAGQSGGYAVNAGAYMGNAASNAANASAYGQVGAGSAWANAANQIAQLPWDKVFNKAPTPQRGAPI